jgi:hypothetical protein
MVVVVAEVVVVVAVEDQRDVTGKNHGREKKEEARRGCGDWLGTTRLGRAGYAGDVHLCRDLYGGLFIILF